MELSSRTRSALATYGIENLEQLANLTEHELQFLPYLGPSGLAEIRSTFKEHNLPLYRNKLERALAQNLEDAELDFHFAIPQELNRIWRAKTLKEILARVNDPDMLKQLPRRELMAKAYELRERIASFRNTCGRHLKP